MISGTDKRFQELSAKFEKAFGDIIPLMMVPESETIEGLTEKVNQCLKEGKDLLPNFYDWNDEDIY